MICGGLVALPVRDVPRAVRFYVETLGMKLVEDRGDDEAVLDAGNGFRVALRRGPAAEAREGAPAVVLEVKLPVAEVVAILDNRGVRVESTHDGARFVDPDGNALHLRRA